MGPTLEERDGCSRENMNVGRYTFFLECFCWCNDPKERLTFQGGRQ
jgi:hypothetical protein